MKIFFHLFLISFLFICLSSTALAVPDLQSRVESTFWHPSPFPSPKPQDDNGGGVPCNVCVILAQMFIVKLESEPLTLDEALRDFCSFLPSPANSVCREYVNKYGATLVDVFFEYESADRICFALGVCTNPEQCVMYPGKAPPPRAWPERALNQGQGPQILTSKMNAFASSQGKRPFSSSSSIIDLLISFFDLSSFSTLHQTENQNQNNENQNENQNENDNLILDGIPPWLLYLGNRFGNEHLPLDDFDNDWYSPLWRTFRGRDWRGRDCNDLDPLVYPGALPQDQDRKFDSNCNGIFGVDNATRQPYEAELCSVPQMGVAILGDSVGAHFAFPCTFYFPNPGVYDHAFTFIENEADWPFSSWITGFRNDTTGLLDPGRPKPLDSVYLRMLERNRCIWNDFQNLAVNGADSGLAAMNIHALARSQTRDRPMLFFQALIGDDICDHRSESGWTQPADFAAAINKNLAYLDGKLPKGSFVVNIGLIDGRVIWDTLHDEPYPFSPQSLGGNATYATWWDFQTCLGTVVCWGWMNPNATVRDQATQRAKELNAVFKNITEGGSWGSGQTYENFQMAYYDFPIYEMFETLVAQGGKPIDFFEPFLGLHPTQRAVALLGGLLYDKLENDFGDVALGPINPNNAKIIQLFGDNQDPYSDA